MVQSLDFTCGCIFFISFVFLVTLYAIVGVFCHYANKCDKILVNVIRCSNIFLIFVADNVLKGKKMEKVIIDLLPYLISGLFAAIGWQFREGYLLKTKVAVLETDLENLQEAMNKDIDALNKNIETIQKRQDSHSKKQDELVNLITDFKLEVVKQISEMSSNLKNLNKSLMYDDDGVLTEKRSKGK